MSALAVAAIVFACVFGGAVLGMVLQGILPEHHLSDPSRDVVRLGTGLVATMAALVLGLLVASAKGAYDAQKNGLDEITANLTLLDSTLAQYGPETQEARAILRSTVGFAIARLWPADASQESTLGAAEPTAGGKSFYDEVLALMPATETQRALQAQSLLIARDLARARLLLIAQQETPPISGVFLVVLTSWLVVLFVSFGLFAPRNTTVLSALLISAFSVSGAIFLIMELGDPFAGLIQISSAPLRNAFVHLGV
ncbi:MAG TPA: hypothetical protein VLV76_22180 [Candidatus Acidoferrum sp.]|nr:hypothetical protein [Candidatus Acidoferrum sp.]